MAVRSVPPTVLGLLEEMLALSHQLETIGNRAARLQPDLARVMADEPARERLEDRPVRKTRRRSRA